MEEKISKEKRFTIPIWALLLSETIFVAGGLCLIIGLLFTYATTTSLTTFGTSLRNTLINQTIGNVTASLVQMEDALFTMTENALMMTFASLDPSVATNGGISSGMSLFKIVASSNTAAQSILSLAGSACRHIQACEGAGMGLGDNMMMAYSHSGNAFTIQDVSTGSGSSQTTAAYSYSVDSGTYRAVLNSSTFLTSIPWNYNASTWLATAGWTARTTSTPMWGADARSVVPVTGTSYFLIYLSYFRVFYPNMAIDTGNPAQHFSTMAWIGLSLSSLEGALSEFSVTPNGMVYIVTPTGLMVSSSIKNVSQINYGPTSYKAADSPNSYIRESNLYLTSQFGSLSNIPASGLSTTFSSSTGESLLCDVEWLNRTNLQWIVITVIPRSDIWGPVDANSRDVVISTIVVGIFGGLISVAMALALTQPIRLLQIQMVKAREFDFSGLKSGYLESRSIFTEINSMQTTFVQMLQKFANGIKQNKELLHGNIRSTVATSVARPSANAGHSENRTTSEIRKSVTRN
ncbi:hypothetical protein SmJEL517_g05748 [Synchytrium microbalum]|uniref:HAMP domain-containing protein n=1 Tax=Synchytrium microbalum TaxID=1806994 RepID=A0A507BU60_9FUNG|nr:uncharacterized protein SmJEL517_g05748 [Synchytrium microbalum]TPX30771.1 hypothetical protein SmJEL517_g05748 [Synchytrium microbalum]